MNINFDYRYISIHINKGYKNFIICLYIYMCVHKRTINFYRWLSYIDELFIKVCVICVILMYKYNCKCK